MNTINFQTIMNSGQCFRMSTFKTECDEGYEIIAKDNVIRVIQDKESGYAEFINTTQEDVETFWRPYFDIETDYQLFADTIMQAGDQFLCNALQYSRGMRILRQDFWEMLVSFLISQNNNIPRIKKTINALCSQFGAPVYRYGQTYYAFPTKEDFQGAITSIDDLNGLGLGYRQKYLYELIRRNSSEIVPEYDKLIQLPGVGPKVASCVLLYGAHDMTQFPVDTWIRKAVHDIYGHEFDTTPYRGFEGFVQQIMFYYYRHLKGAK